MSEAINEAELGRSKKSNSPSDHLHHLLALGWPVQSPLIQKYVLKYRLQAQLTEWESSRRNTAVETAPSPKLKNRKV